MKNEILEIKRKKINELVNLKTMLDFVIDMMFSGSLKDGSITCDDEDLNIHAHISF